MRFVPTKTPEHQSGLVLHRTRQLFIRQQTSVTNAIRGHLAEFGIVAPVGRNGVEELLNVVTDTNDKQVPEVARGPMAIFPGSSTGLRFATVFSAASKLASDSSALGSRRAH